MSTQKMTLELVQQMQAPLVGILQVEQYWIHYLDLHFYPEELVLYFFE
jgi:hypothetical protein